MQVTILYDNYAVNRRFSVGWGFSCLIDNTILFDTGESGKAMLENMRLLDIDIGAIEGAVISHDHWDHTGGLWELLKLRPGLKVFSLPDFSPDFKQEVTDLKGELVQSPDCREIYTGIYTSGSIAGSYQGSYIPEQALILNTEKGYSVITGCSHPGVVTMLKTVRNELNIDSFNTVMGGFHIEKCDDNCIKAIIKHCRDMGVKNSGPTHCSGKRTMNLFKKEYKDNFIKVLVGMRIEL